MFRFYYEDHPSRPDIVRAIFHLHFNDREWISQDEEIKVEDEDGVILCSIGTELVSEFAYSMLTRSSSTLGSPPPS